MNCARTNNYKGLLHFFNNFFQVQNDLFRFFDWLNFGHENTVIFWVIILYPINLIRSFPIKSVVQGGPRDLTGQIGLIGYKIALLGRHLGVSVCSTTYERRLPEAHR